MKRLTALALALVMMLSACTKDNSVSELKQEASVTESQAEIIEETSVTGETSTETEELTTELQSKNQKETAANESETQTREETESLVDNAQETEQDTLSEADIEEDTIEEVPEFSNLGDPALLQYIEDSVSAELAGEFQSEDYIIENVSAIYYSKEYLEEVAYNSQSNIFFGYTLEELDEQFQGTAYVFTLGDNGETVVQPFEDYDDTYDQVIKNVAIGTGVILICVTVSVVTGGLGAAPVSMVFAASAKTGTTMALSSGLFSGVVAGTIKGIQTGDFNEAIKAAALSGSESFKWGAISGAITGAVSEISVLRNASSASEAAENATTGIAEIPSWRESETAVLEAYGGTEQVTYLAGERVSFGTPGATRPDVVRNVDGCLEAIEVKNYNLDSAASRNVLYSELQREIADRVENLPEGSTQRIVLDVTGRNFSTELIEQVIETIKTKLANIYPNIPIDIME